MLSNWLRCLIDWFLWSICMFYHRLQCINVSVALCGMVLGLWSVGRLVCLSHSPSVFFVWPHHMFSPCALLWIGLWYLWDSLKHTAAVLPLTLSPHLSQQPTYSFSSLLPLAFLEDSQQALWWLSFTVVIRKSWYIRKGWATLLQRLTPWGLVKDKSRQCHLHTLIGHREIDCSQPLFLFEEQAGWLITRELGLYRMNKQHTWFDFLSFFQFNVANIQTSAC